MITELNFAKLTPSVWAAMNANDVDISVAYSMVKQNLREGKAVNPSLDLPDEVTPDWAALGEAYNAVEHTGDISSASNAWIRILKAKAFELAPLWRAADYQGMVDLVAAAADPGPVGSGPARQEWEEAQHPEEPDDE